MDYNCPAPPGIMVCAVDSLARCLQVVFAGLGIILPLVCGAAHVP